jgi:hypothetical protein
MIGVAAENQKVIADKFPQWLAKSGGPLANHARCYCPSLAEGGI